MLYITDLKVIATIDINTYTLPAYPVKNKTPAVSPGPNVTHEKKHCPYQL
jgi:hypothetical protein